MIEKKIIVIQGPTASGKTKVSLNLAENFDIQIISADSRQFYHEMNIGTAKPTHVELQKIKHHFVSFISIHDHYNASDFENEALSVIDEVFKQNSIPTVVGGSGLYVDAILKGFNQIPDINMEIRQNITKIFEEQGLDPLLKQLKSIDPHSYNTIDLKNFRRVLRALEVTLSSGKPYSSYLDTTNLPKRSFTPIQIGLEWPIEDLYEKIELRCDQMMEAGLLSEVKELYPHRNLTPLKTIGYQEFFNHLEGKYSLDFAIEKFKQHSRNYAKRQMTWLRRNKEINWFKPHDFNKISEFLTINVLN